MSKKIAIAVVILAALGGAFALFGRGKRSPEGPGAGPEALSVVERRDLEVAAEAAGLVEPIRVVEVKSRASGEVLRVLVETGDRVEAGALLAEIDARDAQNAMAQARADLESARVQFQTADANRKRMEQLRGTGAATQQEYEAAVQGAAAARASVVRAQTNVELARLRTEDVTIRAPIAGTILQRAAQPGQIIASATTNVAGGTTLFTMADLGEMQVRAKVDETDIGQVAPGQTALVTVEAYRGRTFTGTILKIEPQAVVEQNVTMFPVLVRLENREGLLRPGMNAEVKVQIARRPGAIAVPNSAVVSMRDARAAAVALGIDEARLRRPGQADGGQGPAPGAATPECQELRETVRTVGFEGLSDEQRSALRACRGGGGPERPRETRPAMVFVHGGSGVEPRRVTVGLSDWEHTEVLEGLEVGEKVVLVSVAQLQRQQQERMDRMRQRAGGGLLPGSGGSRSSRGGGRQ